MDLAPRCPGNQTNVEAGGLTYEAKAIVDTKSTANGPDDNEHGGRIQFIDDSEMLRSDTTIHPGHLAALISCGPCFRPRPRLQRHPLRSNSGSSVKYSMIINSIWTGATPRPEGCRAPRITEVNSSSGPFSCGILTVVIVIIVTAIHILKFNR